jgi:hypothetical protein
MQISIEFRCVLKISNMRNIFRYSTLSSECRLYTDMVEEEEKIVFTQKTIALLLPSKISQDGN